MKVTRDEIIIRMMPFSKEIKRWCKLHPEFALALKITNPQRFTAFQAISTSFSPFKPEDEVIGFYVYDSLKQKIKQDYIINLKSENKEFILYTKLPSRQYSRYVRHINEFKSVYSQGKYFIDSHHPKFEDLDDQLKIRAERAIRLGEKLKQTGIRNPSEEDLIRFDIELKKYGL